MQHYFISVESTGQRVPFKLDSLFRLVGGSSCPVSLEISEGQIRVYKFNLDEDFTILPPSLSIRRFAMLEIDKDSGRVRTIRPKKSKEYPLSRVIELNGADYERSMQAKSHLDYLRISEKRINSFYR
jgi:hypothetical protein